MIDPWVTGLAEDTLVDGTELIELIDRGGRRAVSLRSTFNALSDTRSNNLIACLGDSLTFVNYGEDSAKGTGDISPPTQGILQSRGYAFWAQTLSDARVRFPQEYNFGVSGETSAQILARAPLAAACPAGSVAVYAGANDRGAAALTAQQTIDNLTAILNILLNAAKRVFLFTVPPRGDSTTAFFSADQLLYWNLVNDWIKRVATQTPGVILVDAVADLADQAATTGIYRAGMCSVTDTTHYGPSGAFYVGRAFANQITRIFPHRDSLPGSNGNLFDAVKNPYGLLSTNPMMQGTGGTVANSSGATTSTTTGGVADGYSLTGSDSNLTATGSKVASGTQTGQRIVLGATGNAAQTTPLISLSQAISQTGGRIVAGDTIEAFCRVSVAAGMQNVAGLFLHIQETYNPGSGNTTIETKCGDTGHVAGTFYPAEAWSGTFVTPPLVIPAGGTSLQARLRIVTVAGVQPAGTVDVFQFGVRRFRPYA